jgi:hypothetical protein
MACLRGIAVSSSAFARLVDGVSFYIEVVVDNIACSCDEQGRGRRAIKNWVD